MKDIFKDDETGKAHQKTNFKEKILADLEAASLARVRRLAEEERLRQEELKAEMERKQAEAEAALRLAREEAARAEAERLEMERQARLMAEEAKRQEEAAAEAVRQAREEAARLEAERQAQLAELARQEEEARRQAEYEAYVAEQAVLEQERLAEKARLTQEILAARQAQETVQEVAEELPLAEVTLQEPVAMVSQPETIVVEEHEPLVEPEEVVSQIAVSEPSVEEPTQSEPLSALITEPEEETQVNQPLLSDDDEDDVYLPPRATAAIGLGKKAKKNRLAKKLSLVVASILLFLILAVGGLGIFYVSSAVKPLDKQATEFIQVEIPEGSGNRLIGQVLEEAGVIKSGIVFNYYTKFKNYTGFQSGYYNFQKSMSLDDISKLLQEGGTPEPVLPALGKIVIPEGYTLTQIAKVVTSNGATEDKTDKTPFKEEDFLALVQKPEFIERMVAKYPNLLSSLPDAGAVKYRLEGYLFPATYAYYETTTLEGLVEEMLSAMDGRLSPYYGQIAERGMTVNDVLSLASLVEKEGQTDDDRRQIASVFYNRLAIDMPLQSNIAILYAMDKLGDKTTLAEDAGIDTTIDSPYNIYVNPGLTPGPVDSPSLSAIEASIEPAKTNYLYFVADVTTGAVYYADTFEEHNSNVEKYVNSHLD